MKAFNLFIYIVGALAFGATVATALGPVTYVMVSTALGPIGICPDIFPFYTENLGFYIEVGDIRSVLGTSYPGFESKEDFQAYRDLYMLEHDRRLDPNKLSVGTQKSIVMVAGFAATGIVLYGAYKVVSWFL